MTDVFRCDSCQSVYSKIDKRALKILNYTDRMTGTMDICKECVSILMHLDKPKVVLEWKQWSEPSDSKGWENRKYDSRRKDD